MSKLKLLLLKHKQYGRDRLYPGDSISSAICKIAKKATLNKGEIDILEEAGVSFVVKTVTIRPGGED